MRENRLEERAQRSVQFFKKNLVPTVFLLFLFTLPIWEGLIAGPLHIRFLEFMRLVGIYTIVAVGLNLLIGYAGQISLGHGAFMGVGAYTSALLAMRWHLPVWVAMLLAILFTALIGLAISPILRLRGHYLALATLGFAVTCYVLIKEMAWLTKGNTGIYGIPKFQLFGWRVSSSTAEYYFIWIIAFLVLIFSRNLVNSRVGRALRALHHSELAAETMGVDTSWYKIKVFTLSAAFAGLAGALYAHMYLNILNPEKFNLTLSIILMVMVVLGGMASIWGSLAGSAFVVFLPEFLKAIPIWFGNKSLNQWFSNNYSNLEPIIFGAMLVLIMIFMPAGLTRGLSDLLRYRRNPLINPLRKEGRA